MFDRYYVNVDIDNYNWVCNAPHKLYLNNYKIKTTALKKSRLLAWLFNDYIYNWLPTTNQL